MEQGERFNAITHFMGTVVAIVGTVILVVIAARSGQARQVTAMSVYGATLVLLYLISTLYHGLGEGRAKHPGSTIGAMKPSRLVLVSVTAMLVLLLAGCDRVTRDNYEKLETGMTMDEVVKILGEPTDLKSFGVGPLEAATGRWEGKKGTISIQFTGQKVRVKRFLAGEAAEDDGHDNS
jgi:hypothetical protein